MFGMLIIIGFIVLAIVYSIVRDFASMAYEQHAIEAEYKHICNQSIINDKWLKASTDKAFKTL